MKKTKATGLFVLGVCITVFGCKDPMTASNAKSAEAAADEKVKAVKIVSLKYKSPGADSGRDVTVNADQKTGEVNLWYCVDHVKAEDFSAEFTVDGESKGSVTLKPFNTPLPYDGDKATSNSIKLEVPQIYGRLDFVLTVKREAAPPDYSKYALEVTSVKYKEVLLKKGSNGRYQLEVPANTEVKTDDFEVLGSCRDRVDSTKTIFSNKKITLKNKSPATGQNVLVLVSDMKHYKGVSSANAKAIVDIKSKQ